MIVLALVAGLGIGLALGLLLDGKRRCRPGGHHVLGGDYHRRPSTTAAPSTTAVSTTVSPAGPTEAFGAAITVTGTLCPCCCATAATPASACPCLR